METAKPETITWQDFMKVGLHFGTIVQAEVFAEARKPAYKLMIDFGPDIGLRKSSSQITVRYRPEELIGRQVLCVVNFPPKQIGPLMSEVLTTGVDDAEGHTVLVFADGKVENGARLL
ncbi:MAG: tRNA-binding protein [Bdellovibrionales bacterium]|jgi:tRNA-binding protein|nr:tRNA-binding protein [Bdellovibrionales bacterium]